MAKLVALEWDAQEARVAVARTARGANPVIEQAFAIPLGIKDADGAVEDESAVGPKLAEALAQRKIGRAEAVVALGRANIELRRMQLPLAPPEELPDMVRFQAMRQFSNIGEQWSVDFIPLGQTESNIDVLAAAISPAVVENMHAVCEAAELTAKHLVLRPFAAASLLRRHRPNERRCRLVVDVLSSDADLFVLSDEKVAFVRTVRLPHTDGVTPALVTAMLGEVRRTIAAAQSQLGGRRIEAITVCGDPTQFLELQSALESQLNLPIEFFNPFTEVALSPELQASVPEFPGRYAPLVGMLLDAATGTPHTIDFLHPRRRPETQGNRQRVLIWSTVAIAACCLLAAGVKFQFNRMDRENATLRATLESLQPSLDAAERKSAELDRIEEFLAGDIPWLVELAEISDKLPPARDLIVDDFTAQWAPPRTAGSLGEGQIVLKGRAQTSDLVTELRRALGGGERYRVEGKGYTSQRGRTAYRFSFDETLRLIADRTPDSEQAEDEEEAELEDGSDAEPSDPRTESLVPSPSSTAGTPAERQSS